ncbi:MAG: ABC transporter permease [Methylovulum sp.]|nr:ABC transporter permease [Methylovulum sp.]
MIKHVYENPRTHLAITLGVWKALLLREAVSRISAGRAAWAWLLVEPVIHIAFMIVIFTVVRMRAVGGIETGAWLIAGLMSFFMFKRAGTQARNALNANSTLFAYRQVKPVDTVLMRALLEGFLSIIITVIVCIGALFFNINVAPDDPLTVFVAFFGLWLIGIGYGLILSVITTLVSEIGKVIDIAMTPIYMVSGVIFPLANLPVSFRKVLLLNPLAHGVEAARMGVSSYYHVIPELDIAYLYECGLGSIFLGLALHRYFETKLIMR